ncbi:MAG: glycerate kinase [Gammaproteobacteria bacterium]|nr:glycerate kinase [Gammaproteobacteria bacterium]
MAHPPVILIAPNALKGSLSAPAAARAIAAGVRRTLPQAELRLLPVADGGDGVLEVLEEALAGERMMARVPGPLGTLLDTHYIYVPGRRLALLEMARVAGLALLRPAQYDPLQASTRGLGELLRAALDHGAEEILLGIGGSASNDGGIGMAAALGVRFWDGDGQAVEPLACNLVRIQQIDTSGLDPRLKQTRIQLICDVDNPLLGAHGATRVFGPQKGAGPTELERLEAGLAHLADLMEQQLDVAVRELPGAGAAGGLGAGAVAFLGAELRPGTELVLELLDFDAALQGADLVITAEGHLDTQTLNGKAPVVVARHATARGIPCMVLAGGVDADPAALREAGFSGWQVIRPEGMPLADSMRQAEQLLAEAAERLVRECLL